jgi:hypothetical protein
VEHPLARKNRISYLGGIIPPSGSLDVDFILLSSFISTKYIVECSNEDEAVFSCWEMTACRESATVTDSIYNKIGNPMNLTVEFLIVGSDAVLRIGNNEAYPVSVRALRLNLS